MKKINANDPEIKKIMGLFAKQFQTVLEKYCTEDDELECDGTDEHNKLDDDDEFECNECGETYESRNFRPANRRRPNIINEMAITRAVDRKALANVRDMISRRGFDRDWATNVPALPKFDDIELLNRYVAALLVFHEQCPTTMEEVDQIGVFKNYAHKMIDDGTITLEDVKKLYDKSPALAVRPRTGTTRAASGFRKTATKDFDFDAPETPAPAAAPAIEEPVIDEPEDIEEPELTTADNDDFISSSDVIDNEPGDYPAYDDNDDEEELPEEVAAAIADSGVDTEMEIEDNSGEIREIENINDLTADDYYDPGMNASFHAHNDDNILMEGNKVGFMIRIADEDGEILGEYKMLRDSFGKALEDYTIAAQASVIAMTDTFYDLQITKVINVFYKLFNNALNDDQQDEIDSKINKFYYGVFQSAKSVDDVIKGLEEQED
jgi:hypothetical protein